MEVVHWCKQQVDEEIFLPGERFLSENQLCGQFGLSRQTIRHALSVLEKDGYIKKIRGSGTYVSGKHREKQKKTMNIGVISTYLDDYIFPGILQGIESVLSPNGYTILFASTSNKLEDEKRALLSMLEKGVDGLIVEPTKSGLPNINLDIYKQMQENNIPFVFFNAFYPSLGVPFVALDDEQAGFQATRYLIDAGHKKIGGIFLLDDMQGHLRYSGYTKAMEEAGMPINEKSIIWYTTEDKAELLQRPDYILRKLDGCSAVFCYNDQLSVQLFALLKEQGITIPKDLSVVSIDNSDMAAMCSPPLTTVVHPMQTLGCTAANTLLALLAEQKVKNILYPPEIIVRKSVAQKNKGRK